MLGSIPGVGLVKNVASYMGGVVWSFLPTALVGGGAGLEFCLDSRTCQLIANAERGFVFWSADEGKSAAAAWLDRYEQDHDVHPNFFHGM